MSLLAKLFKTKVKELTIEERIAALDAAPASELSAIATSSTDDAVREAASKKLGYSPQLLDLALKGEPARVQNAARQRIGQLLQDGSLAVEQLRNDVSDTDQLFSLASYSAKSIEQLIEGINDEGLLLKLSLEASTTQARQTAANKIVSREVLEALFKGAKGKDKAVFKIAKAKLDVFKARDAKLAEQFAEVESIVVDAERHAKKPYDHLYTKLLVQIENAWRDIESKSSPDLSERYKIAKAKCHATLDEHNEAEEARKREEQLDEQAAVDIVSAKDAVKKLMGELLDQTDLDEKLEAKIKSVIAEQDELAKKVKARGLAALDSGFKAYNRAAEDANNLWLKLQDTGSLKKIMEELKEAGVDEGRDLIKKARHLLNYVSDVNPLPEFVAEAQATIKEWEKEQKEKTDKIREDLRDISGLIRKANWAVEKGFVRKARGVQKDLKEKCEQFIETVPQGLANKIEQLEEDIAKLGDWHTFATTPKKESLVEQMEALVGVKLAPQDLADKIHNLQQEWKTLCRGGENQDQDLWERFQTAADKAYEPCKEYFNAQAEERDGNVEKRRELIAQLTEYIKAYDWDNAVWKDVEQTIKVARETWQSYWPIPRKLIKPLQSEFDDIIDKIYQPMNEAYAAGKSARERLVEQAKAIVEKELSVADKAEEVKKLQELWKKAGRTRRKDDQTLWKEFRVHCDKVFEERQKQYDEQNAERDGELTKAVSVIEEAEAILDLSGDQFFSSLNTLDDIKQRFSEVGDLPRNKEKSIHSRFNKALANIENKIQKEKNAGQEKAWTEWFDAAERLRLLELSILQGQVNDDEQSSLGELLDSDTQWPSGGLACLKERFAKLDALKESSDAEREEHLRLLCIQAEVLCDVETPEEDKERRMQYQVAQLQKGMGQGASDSKDITTLTLDWFKVPAVDDSQYQPLYERFMKCRAEALA